MIKTAKQLKDLVKFHVVLLTLFRHTDIIIAERM